QVPEIELRVDRGPVETLSELRDEVRDRAAHDADSEWDRRVGLRDESLLDRLVDHRGRAEDVGRDENERGADRQLERLFEFLLDGGRRRLRRQSADRDS